MCKSPGHTVFLLDFAVLTSLVKYLLSYWTMVRFYSYKVQYQVMESSCNEILRAGVGTFPVLAERVRGFKCPAEVKERENDKEWFPVLKTFRPSHVYSRNTEYVPDLVFLQKFLFAS